MNEEKNFFDDLMDALKKQGNRLDIKILKKFIGGQAKIIFPTTNDCLLGNIKGVLIESGCLEISCAWIAHKQRRGSSWSFDRRRSNSGNLVIHLKVGWDKNWDVSADTNTLIVNGEEGNMLLRPACTEFIHASEVKNYLT